MRIEFVNEVDDHRLRVLFPTRVRADAVWAEDHFDVVRRPIRIPTGDGWNEAPYPTKHLGGFVYLGDAHRGFGVIGGDVTEYEVMDDPDRTLALTLVRSVGWLARHDLERRRDRAGPTHATPDAQCHGTHVVRFAVCTGRGDWDHTEIMRQATLFAVPARAVAVRSRSGVLPPRLSLFHVTPASLVVSAVKPRDRGVGAVIRVWNPSTSPMHGRITFGIPIAAAALLNLGESVQRWLSVRDNGVDLELRGNEIATIGITANGGDHDPA